MDVFREMFRALGALLAGIFGNISWRAPGWLVGARESLNGMAAAARRNPRRALGIGSAVIVAAALGIAGYRWYQARPRPVEPVEIAFSVAAPAATNHAIEPREVHPLRVRFEGSVAPIERVGKDVLAGIRSDPALAGTWHWESDSELVFRPRADWPIGEEVAISFDVALLFAPQVRIADHRFEFMTPAFTATVAESEFYQDPQDPLLKKVIVAFAFSHPVDVAGFERRLEILLSDRRGKPKPRAFTVTYDEHKLRGFVHSERLSLPREAQDLTVTLAKGVQAARGGHGTAAPVVARVPVPGLYSLAVAGAEPTLVDNARFEPEQVLVVSFSQSVSEAEAKRTTHAWLLPLQHPDPARRDRDLPFQWSAQDVGENVLAQAERLPLERIASEQEHSELHSFRYQANVGRFVFLRVDRGLKSFGGYLLGKHDTRVLQVPPYPRTLRFLGEGSLLSLSGEKRVAVVARNLPGMRVEVARLLPRQLQHLVSFNEGTYPLPELGAMSPEQITERFVQETGFPAIGPSKAHYEGVDLAEYLGKPDRRGVFLLRLYEHDPANPQEWDGELFDSRLVVVTDLGLVLKKSRDGSLDVFVQSIANGAPVVGARVDVLGRNGETIASESSDTEGRVRVAPLHAFKRERSPALIVVSRGEDLSFLPLDASDRKLDYSRFDVGGIESADEDGELTAHLFSDRGLYRPGDTFHIGMIVRTADFSRPLDALPLQVDITDPNGLRVASRLLTLGAQGFEETSHATGESSPTGTYSINLSLVKRPGETRTIGSTTVEVKEFLPDRMKASASLSRSTNEGWIKPDGLGARVSLQNLFGTPAQDRRVQAKLTLSPVFPAFPSHPGYRFFDPRHAREPVTEDLGEQKTGADGEALFPLELERFANATYRLHFLARGFEAEGGRSVAAEVASMVSPLDHMVGAKADGDLEYVERAAERSAEFIAIDPDARRTGVAGLTAALVERRFVSILTKQDSGVYKYESRAKELPVSDQPLTIPAGGVRLPLDTSKPGSFALVVRDANGEELNRVAYSVAGEANLSRSLERNAELELTLSKADYAAGDEIEVSIRAPYSGTGLITIERERVFAHAWFKADTTASVQRIRIPEGFEGNGYINVEFMRDPSSDEIFMSPMSYGVAPFSVDRQARKAPVRVVAPTLVKPGQKLSMRVEVDEPARVVVFAVDEGILQVARYKLVDPLEHFFRKRRLEVETSQILDLILPEFAKLMGMAAPGGDADGLLGRNLNPFRKKRAAPVVYWSGLMDVEATKTLEWTVPEDFNGSLRIMAVAVTPERMGIFEGATSVRGDFVLSPNVPAMVAPGDEFEVSVGVSNNVAGLAGTSLPITVALAPSQQVVAVGAPTRTLTLAGMREGVAVFRLKAKAEPGVAALRFTASSGKYAARQSVEISVRPAVPYRTEVATGEIGSGAEIKPLRDMFGAFAKREASVSHVPLVLTRGLSAYLTDFPHACTEQLLSQGIPGLVFEARPEFATRADGTTRATPAQAFEALLATLRTRQNDEGGFGLWTATPDSERYVSAYAIQFLLEAKERGRAVPADMLERGNQYLTQLAADESDNSLAGLRERAFAVYLLTRTGQVTSSPLALVRQRLEEGHAKAWRSDIAAAYVAASLRLLRQDREAMALIRGPEGVLKRKTTDAAYAYERYHDPVIADATTLYLIARHFPERAQALPREAVGNIVRALQRGWYNTLSSAMTVLALDAFAGPAGEAAGTGLAMSEVLADGKARALGELQGLVLRGTFSGAAQALRFGNAADLDAWYSVSQSGFDRAPPTVARKQGLEVSRDFTDAAGKPVTRVKLGEEIHVRVKIRATRDEGIDDIVIVDLLPGGFEPVQEFRAPPAPVENSDEYDEEYGGEEPAPWQSPIGLASSTWQPHYADVRDDRVVIYGYADTRVQEFVYRIKATNVGSFVVPPAYGESLYDRTVQAQSPGGRIEVVR